MSSGATEDKADGDLHPRIKGTHVVNCCMETLCLCTISFAILNFQRPED